MTHPKIFSFLMTDVQVFISGAGVAGLLLALALKKMNLNVTVYEQAPAFADGVGGEFAVYNEWKSTTSCN